VVIIGKRIVTYWKRPGEPGQRITTIRHGAVIDHHWRQDLQEKGKAEARVLSDKTGINLAAVDFVFPLSERDPDPLFLEINYYFGRRGLGGSERYYALLYQAIQEWIVEAGLNPKSIVLL
jgi:ribosomal protein S6--L-glutamate ligase